VKTPLLLRALAPVALILQAASTAAAPAATGPVVVTTAGAVAGTDGKILSFKGIPYAAPPLGQLRWRPPQPPQPWSGVRDATRFGDDCMQTPYVIPTGQKPSEDCLKINVWTPAGAAGAAGSQRPVLVFLYGGAFIGGSCAYPLYDGERLAARGLVVVCFNYRVGIFGLLAHPQLTAESPQHSSGNYTLLDQIAALRWVRANIGAFGGDPHRVTVLGESAGAASIAMLMTSPLARGLFDQAIMASPVLLALAPLEAAEKSGAALGADLAALRELGADQLLAHNGDFFPRSAARAVMGMAVPAPIVDGYVLQRQPRDLYQEGAVAVIPTIVGNADQEGRMFVPGQTSAGYEAWLRDRFGPLATELLRLHPAPTDEAATAGAVAILGDALFGEAARAIARGVAAHQPRVFVYVFSRGIAGQPQPATHSEILPFMFGTLDQPSFISHAAPDPTDFELSATVQRLWANFAAHGDPNGPGLPPWPAYERGAAPFLELGTRVRAGQNWHRAQLDLLEDTYLHDQP
jgi:para-nitrobenzyl esterase